MKTYIFTTKLLNSRTAVTRDVEDRGDSSLYRLAEAIVHAYDFDFDHAFGFFSRTEGDYFRSERKYELFADMADVAAENPDSRSVRRTTISEVWNKPGEKMLFLFDYGDQWRFIVELQGFGSVEPKRKYPRILGRVGTSPEQYPQLEEE
jgi:Plasmid pRiA4b ORF-3-like protein